MEYDIDSINMDQENMQVVLMWWVEINIWGIEKLF